MVSPARQALFISHANPQDNAFTLWLGAKLTALGYQVFADVLRLRGGQDWERILEDAIRNKAAKFLLVATPHGVQKQGVRNEITIASDTAKKINDNEFIVPLRLAPYDSPLLIAHAQYINFERGWSAGLSELQALLSEIRRSYDTENLELWSGIQLKDARVISSRPERLLSNWLAIDGMPDRIKYYDFKGSISHGAALAAIRNALTPLTPFNRGFLSFATLPPLQDQFGPDLALEVLAEHPTEAFLQSGCTDPHIVVHDARAKFTDLVRRGLNGFFGGKGLHSFELASERLVWWPTLALATMSQRSFAWPDGPSGRRQLVGHSKKRNFYWHYGVSCWARNAPTPHVRVSGHVIFTSDGRSLISDDAKRLHRLRRSFCKSWRNDKWRDLLLAFWHWLSAGSAAVEVPLGDTTALTLRLPPMMWDAPFGIETASDAEPDTIDEEDKNEDEDEEEDETVEGNGEGTDDDDEYQDVDDYP
jgi:hypothetical protein